MAASSASTFRYETDVFVYKAQCQWVIRNWRHAVKDGSNSFLDSPPFHAEALPDVQWHMRLWPNRRYGTAQPPQMDMAIFVTPPDAVHSTEMICSLYDAANIAEEDGAVLASIKRSDYWGLSSRVFAKPEELMCRDLMLDCTIRHSLKSSPSRANLAQMDTTQVRANLRSVRTELEDNERQKLTDAMSRLLDNDRFADITLCLSSGHKCRAHRSVLALRSPVFRAMFSSDLTNPGSTSVALTEESEVDEAVWSAFMAFLYTGAASELDVHCLSLLKLADKYEVPGLKALSSMAIAEQLQAESVPHALVLAHLHRAPELRDAAHRFIRRGGRDVYCTEAWRRLMTEWPDVAVETLAAVSPPGIQREMEKAAGPEEASDD